MITDRSIINVAANQVSSDLAGEVVVLNLENGVYYGLDPVGARIWQLLQEPTSIEDLLAALMDEYEVEPERCREDLLALLEDLEKHQLLEVHRAPAGA